ncbi:type IV secretion system DNA-binding domain-containing protein [Candidatus Pacebacteria bacterium]|nr:type IV secretion system DNA-binding domain-containing protein [Candidatus Paceibacterota bacterium]
MEFDPNKITFFAKTDARGADVPFGIKAIDRGKHMYVIGKTGMGKSTLLENMAVQDIKNGEGLAFIDPHGATAETLLDYIPEERKDDVLYFAPFDAENPIAFNVMEDVGPDKRHLVVSGLMSVFKKIWVDAWSARMEYILQNTLLALLEYPDSTLLGVNRMLSEKNYRKRVIENISDPAVKSFWVDEFLKYNERYMQEAGDAIKNKIGQFTANPLIRNIIGQPKSSFDIRQMMDERKIIIMNLSKGLVGESNANLLGSMLTTRIYLAAMSRADMSQDKLREAPNFYFYVDEFQSFANATFADILSEARKYKLNLTIAHQYIEQMEEEVRNAVFGNVGTIISFRVGPFDAEVLETIFAPQFYAVDICNLGFAQVYLTLMIDGIGSQPFSAVTLPPIERASVSCKDMVIHTSQKSFAKPRSEVEAAIIAWHENPPRNASSNPLGNGTNSINKVAEKKIVNKSEASIKQYEEARQQPEKRLEEKSALAPKVSTPKPYARPNQKNDLQTDTKTRNNTVNKRPEERVNGNNVIKKEGVKETISQKQTAPTGNDKKLDELRAVLAGLTKKEEVKEKKSENQQRTNSDRNAKLRVVRKSQGEREDEIALKKALQGALKNKENKENKENPSQEETKPVAIEEKTSAVQQSNPPVVKPVESSIAQAQRSKDPLDPKALERMMRVTTSDKTPLK